MLQTACILTVHFTAKPGKEDALREALIALIAPTRKEPGCLLYTLHEIKEKGHYFFYEAWTSNDALEQHRNSDHIQALLSKQDTLIETVSVTAWNTVKTTTLEPA